MFNTHALAYWRQTGYSAADVDATCRQMDNVLSMRINFLPKRRMHVSVSEKVGSTGEGHALAVIKFIEDLLNVWRGKEFEGSIIIWLEDRIGNDHRRKQSPIFTFGTFYDDNYSLIMPDPAFLGSQGYSDMRARIQAIDAEVPWGKKQPTLFWRGASSGFTGLKDDEWQKAPRAALVYAAKAVGDVQKVDAIFTKLVDYSTNNSGAKIREDGLLGEHVLFRDFLRFRYLIDVDGETCAWQSLFLKLTSASLVVKVPGVNLHWYYEKLIPWVHYVPLSSDCSDLLEIYNWVINHDQACQEMAISASQLVSTLSYQRLLEETAATIAEVLSYGRWPCD